MNLITYIYIHLHVHIHIYAHTHTHTHALGSIIKVSTKIFQPCCPLALTNKVSGHQPCAWQQPHPRSVGSPTAMPSGPLDWTTEWEDLWGKDRGGDRQAWGSSQAFSQLSAAKWVVPAWATRRGYRLLQSCPKLWPTELGGIPTGAMWSHWVL